MKALAALSDAYRRRIVEILVDGEMSAGELGSEFEISQPAVSRHLRVLRGAGLVASRPAARQRVYRLNPVQLGEVDAWFSRLRAALDRKRKVNPTLVRYPGRMRPDPDELGKWRRLRPFGMASRGAVTAA